MVFDHLKNMFENIIYEYSNYLLAIYKIIKIIGNALVK